MSTFVVQLIVTEDLQMRKVCAKLVPKVLMQDQKELRVLRCLELLDLIQNEPDFLNSVVTGDESWMFEYDPESKRQSCAWHTKSSPRPKKARMSKSRIKTMIIVFFDIRGIVHCEFLPQGQTVNSAFYLEVLRRLKRRIARVRTDIKNTVKLHHDNATSHTAFIITNFLARSNTPVIPHPPYSPDLAPCDFFLFPRLKREMKGKHWETVENIQHHVTTFLRSIPVEEFQGAFQAWQTRLRKCIDAGGIIPQREQLFLNGILDLKLAEFPLKMRTDENVQKITDLIKENPRTTLLELEQDTGISKTTIGRIVTEDLRFKKTPAKFIPRFLTNEQKLCRLATCEDMLEMTRTDPEWKDKIITGDETWVYGYDPEIKRQASQGEPKPKKSRILKSRNKVLLVAFLDNKGIVHHEYLPAGQTVIKEMYLSILRRLREAIRKKKRPEKWTDGDWILHHDNARPHTAHLVTSFLAKNGTEILPQPPYSPDIATNDFFLFPKLKAVLKGRHFDTREDIIEKSLLALKSIPKEAY
ncbi:hypothetical protein LAZ67_6001339 [Cordylochernes scorpioides]|uniref:Transposase n=1 Tax=Cordylochernes scorpioides TaxID=51811 RepID=A0ABY6KJ55_9ARAC|nr:hypothetical protein LAZ67_6001339 [Cordylochernes scorpioides]